MSTAEKPEGWLAEVLKEETAEVLAERDFAPFAAAVAARIEAEVEASLVEPFALSEALREETEEALEDRRLHWSAFTQGVLRELREDARQEARTPLADRAVAELQRDVETELERVEPRFERQFQRELWRRVDSASPSLWERLRAFLWPSVEGWRTGVGLLGAATAVFLLLVAAPRFEAPPARVDAPVVDRGSVEVREVNFDGRVMVIEGEGVTFVYLSDS